MSRHIQATTVYVTTAVCAGTSHAGSTFIREDVPEGTMIIVDGDREWYLPSTNARQFLDGFPDLMVPHSMKFYRDYWHLGFPGGIDDQSPIARALRDVPKRMLIQNSAIDKDEEMTG